MLTFVADKNAFRKSFHVCEKNSENGARIMLGVMPKILSLSVA